MRHGQTDWNLNKLFQGDTDVPLNETGIKQAEEAAQSLSEGAVDLIICSTLTRARQTADLVNRVVNCPILYRRELIERGFGEWEGTDILPKKEDELYKSGHLYNYSFTEIPYDIEPTQALCKRTWGVLEEIKEYYPGRRVLLVTHGGAMRALNAYFCGIGEDGVLPVLSAKNCQLIRYQLKTE